MNRRGFLGMAVGLPFLAKALPAKPALPAEPVLKWKAMKIPAHFEIGYVNFADEHVNKKALVRKLAKDHGCEDLIDE